MHFFFFFPFISFCIYNKNVQLYPRARQGNPMSFADSTNYFIPQTDDLSLFYLNAKLR